MNKFVYMDYHATTPVDKEVLDAMLPYFTEKFGNPASRQHRMGWEAEGIVEVCRGTIAKLIGADAKEIVFTSGATEANNLAIKGVAESLRAKGNHIITVQTEHKSVLDSVKHLQKAGFEATILGVNPSGLINLESLEQAITPSTILVSVMLANNEIGVIQPLAQIARICRAKGVYLHTDATQGMAYTPVNVDTLNVDVLSFSAHKIYGPKGVGALYVRQNNPKVKLSIQADGGGHERGMRSGTLNVPGIVGLAKALEISVRERENEVARIKSLRDMLYSELSQAIPGIGLNGHETERLPNNLNISFSGVEDAALMMSMKDVAVSTGSACSTGSPEPSYVLKALGLPKDRLHSSIRFGLGRHTTREDVEYTIRRVIESVQALKGLNKAVTKNLVSA